MWQLGSDFLLKILGFWKILGWNYWTHVFNKDIEILYLAEICKYMNTPHFRTDLGLTLDRELLTKINVRMLNDDALQHDSKVGRA